MGNAAEAIEKAKSAFVEADRQIKDIDETAYRAVSLMRMGVYEAQRFATDAAAIRTLTELAHMSVNLGQSYVDNALSEINDASNSARLSQYNLALGMCYLIMTVSKARDAIAEFEGNPATKIMKKMETAAKTAAADMMGEVRVAAKGDPHKINWAMLVAQSANLSLCVTNAEPGANALPDAKFWENLQKEVAGVIDLIKDAATLIKTAEDLSKVASDIKLWALKMAEKLAKLLDLVNKVITLYDTTPKVAPDFIKNRAPAALGKLPQFSKEGLDWAKKWLSVTKYTLEALQNFVQCCLSYGEAYEDWNNFKASTAVANRQLTRSAASPASYVLEAQTFAQASKADLIDVIHTVNSAPDANVLSHAAIFKLKQLKADMEEMNRLQKRHQLRSDMKMREVETKTAALRATDRKLEEVRSRLASIADAEYETFGRSGRMTSTWIDTGGGGYTDYKMMTWPTKRDLIQSIDELRAKIARLSAPPVPKWIATHGRVGPRISPQ
jgi:hypothetical protein